MKIYTRTLNLKKYTGKDKKYLVRKITNTIDESWDPDHTTIGREK